MLQLPILTIVQILVFLEEKISNSELIFNKAIRLNCFVWFYFVVWMFCQIITNIYEITFANRFKRQLLTHCSIINKYFVSWVRAFFQKLETTWSFSKNLRFPRLLLHCFPSSIIFRALNNFSRQINLIIFVNIFTPFCGQFSSSLLPHE